MNMVDSALFAHDQLRQLPPGITLAVLHPDFHGQHSLLAPLLQDKRRTTLFLAVSEPDTAYDDLLKSLKHMFDSQADITLPDLPDGAEAAAAVIAKTLNSGGKYTLIIDAFDYVNQEHTNAFITALANSIAPGNRILLGTRELPVALLKSDTLRDKVALIPTHPDRMMLDYAQPSSKSVLEVRALGPGRVLINGRRIDHWDGVLPRMLFFYFVDRGMTTRDEIFETFWPKLTTREATNVFHVTKRKISEILEADLTVYWSGFYRISPELELHYDVVKFAEAVQNAAVAADDEAIILYRNAVALYHGPFLSTIEQQDWADRRRGELVGSYAEALAGLARIYQRQDSKQQALGYYLRAAATNPQREDLARAIMDLYLELGRPTHALDAYERLEKELKASLGVSPDRRTVELVGKIRAAL